MAGPFTAVVLYCEIAPQMTMRDLWLMRVSTVSRMSPPTLSKYTSTPFGQCSLRPSFTLPDSAGGARDHHGFPRFGLSGFEQAEVGGHAGHTERVEPLRRGSHAQIYLRDAGVLQAGLPDHAVFLHTESTGDLVANRERGIVRRDHLAHAACTHHFADADRRDVALALVHPAAHRRVKRELQHLDEYAAGAGIPHRFFGEISV